MIQQSVSKEKGEKVDKGLRGWGGEGKYGIWVEG